MANGDNKIDIDFDENLNKDRELFGILTEYTRKNELQYTVQKGNTDTTRYGPVLPEVQEKQTILNQLFQVADVHRLEFLKTEFARVRTALSERDAAWAGCYLDYCNAYNEHEGKLDIRYTLRTYKALHQQQQSYIRNVQNLKGRDELKYRWAYARMRMVHCACALLKAILAIDLDQDPDIWLRRYLEYYTEAMRGW